MRAIVIAAGVAAYGQTFTGSFLFDDEPTILCNPTIRHWATALAPPVNATSAGRPVVNLSLAINYALSGNEPWSYHVFNLIIHVLAGLTLFGILRQLLSPSKIANGLSIAFFSALLWVLHPIQTESVTYIVQRAESLMGLFYLQTLYWHVRSQEATRSRQSSKTRAPFFATISVVCCALGMATKEVMVSAPLMVLLTNRFCFAGSFIEAWRRRTPISIWQPRVWGCRGAWTRPSRNMRRRCA